MHSCWAVRVECAESSKQASKSVQLPSSSKRISERTKRPETTDRRGATNRRSGKSGTKYHWSSSSNYSSTVVTTADWLKRQGSLNTPLTALQVTQVAGRGLEKLTFINKNCVPVQPSLWRWLWQRTRSSAASRWASTSTSKGATVSTKRKTY